MKVIVLNNDGYHSIRQTQQAYFSDNMIGVGPEDGVTMPDFVKLGIALGIQSARVSTIADWHTAEVAAIMKSDEPGLIEVILDKSQPFSPKLASRKLEDGTMVSPSLEDMAPFLSRAELEENTL